MEDPKEVSEELKNLILDGIKDEIDGMTYWRKLDKLMKNTDMTHVRVYGAFQEEKGHLDLLKGIAKKLGISVSQTESIDETVSMMLGEAYWRFTIDISPEWHVMKHFLDDADEETRFDEDPSFEEARAAVVKKLQGYVTTFSSPDYFGDFESLVQDLGMCVDLAEFNDEWSMIYDWADTNDVWIDTHSPYNDQGLTPANRTPITGQESI